MDERERHVPAWARRFGLSLWLASGIIGPAAAQSSTITFRGAITEPSCRFALEAQRVLATCASPPGQPVIMGLSAANVGNSTRARVGVAQLKLEPHPDRHGADRAYIVVATYL